MKIVMSKYLLMTSFILFILGNSSISNATSPWISDYFTYVSLLAPEGKTVHYFVLLGEPTVVLPNNVEQLQAVGNEVEIKDSWIRGSHSSKEVNTVRMTIVNKGYNQVTIVKFESESFNNIDMYELSRHNGFLEMHEITNIDIPVNGQIQFDPSGKYLMLMRAREYMAEGGEVDMTLTFKSGKKQTVSITVAAR